MKKNSIVISLISLNLLISVLLIICLLWHPVIVITTTLIFCMLFYSAYCFIMPKDYYKSEAKLQKLYNFSFMARKKYFIILTLIIISSYGYSFYSNTCTYDAKYLNNEIEKRYEDDIYMNQIIKLSNFKEKDIYRFKTIVHYSSNETKSTFIHTVDLVLNISNIAKILLKEDKTVSAISFELYKGNNKKIESQIKSDLSFSFFLDKLKEANLQIITKKSKNNIEITEEEKEKLIELAKAQEKVKLEFANVINEINSLESYLYPRYIGLIIIGYLQMDMFIGLIFTAGYFTGKKRWRKKYLL